MGRRKRLLRYKEVAMKFCPTCESKDFTKNNEPPQTPEHSEFTCHECGTVWSIAPDYALSIIKAPTKVSLSIVASCHKKSYFVHH